MIFKIFKFVVCYISFSGFLENQLISMPRDELENNFVRTAIAAGAGMVVDRTLFYPVDFTVTQKQFRKRPVTDIVRQVVREDGVTGLFRGLRIQLFSAVPISGVFALNDIVYKGQRGKPFEKELFAGLASALMFSVVYNPFDIRRTWQVTHKTNYIPNGLYSNFRGYSLQFGRSFIYSLGISGTRYLSQNTDFFTDSSPQMSQYFFAGIIPGCLAQVCMSPVDLIKTRVMADVYRRGALFHLKNVMRERAICDGMLLRVLRHGPATGLIMGVMKWVESTLKSNKNT